MVFIESNIKDPVELIFDDAIALERDSLNVTPGSGVW
jgi:hypothetical protein